MYSAGKLTLQMQLLRIDARTEPFLEANHYFFVCSFAFVISVLLDSSCPTGFSG